MLGRFTFTTCIGGGGQAPRRCAKKASGYVGLNIGRELGAEHLMFGFQAVMVLVGGCNPPVKTGGRTFQKLNGARLPG